MKEIKLLSGNVALVDDEDFEYLNQWKWSEIRGRVTNYACRRHYHKLGRRKYKQDLILMHRVIMKPDEILHIDHVNHNGLDNRKENLRIVNNRENHWNRKKFNKHGYVGVCKTLSKFMAIMQIDGKSTYLGTYETPELAHDAYMKKYNEINIGKY